MNPIHDQGPGEDSTKRQVVVVGSGVAGLSAATAAAESGARVVVLDRASEDESGGNTRYTEAYLRMKSTSEIADDFIDSFVADFVGYPDPSLTRQLHKDRSAWPPMLASLGVNDPDLLEVFASEAGPTVAWLERCGVRFEEIVTQFLTTSTTRIAPSGGGQALIDALRARALAAGVDFVYQMTARALISSGLNVQGVLAAGVDGTPAEFRGRVILASGGFEGNPEMLARYLGAGALECRPVCRGGYYNKGEGITMALDVGAAPAGNFSSFHAEPIDPRSGIAEPSVMAFPYGLLVNIEGRRFVDEAPGPIDATYESISREIHAQPKGLAYAIFDSGIDDIPNHQTAIRTDRPPLKSDTLEGLADALQVPREELRKTVETFNAACGDGANFDPTQLDQTSAHPPGMPRKSNWARPIQDGPFIAYPIIAANVFTYGGLKTNESAQVISQDGHTIRGLYAAGEIVGMYYTSYVGSTSVLRGAVFGRLAGQHAASSLS